MAATFSCSCISSAVSADKVLSFLIINSPPSTQLAAASAHLSQYKQAGTSVGRRRKNGSKRGFVSRSAEPETVAAATDLMSTFSLPTIPGFSLSADINPWWTAITGLAVTVPFVIQRIMAVTKEVDLAAHTIEKIAQSVDKATEEIESALPEGGLKKMVHMVEGLAEETIKDAQKVEGIMHKVEEIDEKLETYLNKQEIKGAKKA